MSGQQGKPDYAASLRSNPKAQKPSANGPPSSSAKANPSTAANNSNVKGNSPPQQQQQPHGNQPAATAAAAVPASLKPRNDPFEGSMHDRLVYASMCLLGHKVEVRVIDGSVIEGIFHTASTEHAAGFGVVLRLAKFQLGPGGQPFGALSDDPAVLFARQSHKTIMIPASEFVSMTATGVDLSYIDRLSGVVDSESSGGFKTDTGISGFSGTLRERELIAWTPDSELEGLEEAQSLGTSGKQWDQFATNQKLYGVKSTFNEELYTTKLDRNSPDYKKHEKEAQKIAAAIEGQSSVNPHMQEERGHAVEMEDEEDLYGAVIRDKQVTPAKKESTPPVTGSPTAQSPNLRAAGGVYRPPQKRQDSQPSSPRQGTPQPSPPPPGATTPPVSTGAQSTGEKRNSIPLSTVLNSGGADLSGKPVQDVIPEVQRDFQKFSQKEKEKVIQRKQSLREEKSAEMKQFSQNLKLPASQPTETAPAAQPAATSPAAATQAKPPTPQAQSPAPVPAPATPAVEDKSKEKKLNPNAKEFVFKAFTPSKKVEEPVSEEIIEAEAGMYTEEFMPQQHYMMAQPPMYQPYPPQRYGMQPFVPFYPPPYSGPPVRGAMVPQMPPNFYYQIDPQQMMQGPPQMQSPGRPHRFNPGGRPQGNPSADGAS